LNADALQKLGLALATCALLAQSAWAGSPGPPEDPFPVSASADAPASPSAEPLAAAPPADAATIWQSLRYGGSVLVGEFDAVLDLSPARSDTPSAPRWVAELRTRMRSKLLPDKEATVRAWFDPTSATVDRFEKLTLGRGASFKRFLFREDGVERVRKEPARGEDPRRHETWAHERSSFVAFDSASHGCQLVSDPGALVYLVSFGPGRWQEDPGACVVSGKTLYRISLAKRGQDVRELRYRVRGDQDMVRSGRRPITRYEVVGTPVAGETTEPVTRMDILVDDETELPFKIVIREGPLQVDVSLQEAVLRQGAATVSP
jgi:hypothetical protein